MHHKSRDLLLVMAITSIAVIVNLIGVNNPILQAPFALPLVLLLPGYAITAALFPKGAIGVSERLLLSLGLSICVTALGGVILNWTPWGLQPASWAVLLGGITLCASLIALRHRNEQAALLIVSRTGAKGEGARSLDKSRSGPKKRLLSKLRAAEQAISDTVKMTLDLLDLRQTLLLGLAVLLVVGAVYVARSGAMQQESGFTQLWITPHEETSEEANENAVLIGIRHMEMIPVNYALEVDIGESDKYRYPSIQFKPNEEWVANVPLPTPLLPGTIVEARLYRLDAPEKVYRRVFWQYIR